MSEQDADLQLVRLVQRGNRHAFDLLVKKYQYKVAGIAQRFAANPADAQDIAQESFIKAYRAMESFRGESAFYTWLYRITVNTAKNFVVKNAGRGISVDVDTPDIEAYDGSERLHQGDNPENILESSDVKRVIKEALQSLPDDLRQAITLREIDDMSYDEIADVMGCPVGTVKSRISRAREIINRKLTESGERLNSKA
ncbi:RNA polymerase sigma factor RpoE [Succinimonas sp.]|jgi:RNA polymerase sigma-70 factor (ECF subfamily)|uniref:RNA polymerase sigma factor RpoE n=1 Tax=Succinimonas sp. TaxID=1936151 RepID=UPI002E8C50A1|nr:RNA polymerase sigma factor RpoE [Succinimonas sp.]